MDDSGAILCQISSLKDMLDQVNEEIEANIRITREIESEIVKCTEFEAALAARESDLTKTFYFSQFEINGLLSVAYESKKSVKLLEEEVCGLRKKKMEMPESMDDKREQFVMQCLEFQRDIDKGENEVVNLLSEKEFLENEFHLLDERNNALKNFMWAFMDETVQDLLDCNSALDVEIRSRNPENEKLLKDLMF
ncbi:CAP-gly domain linker [Salix suchowensis]|nr:CAP-gly domain linker [Salix suchowensis]